MPTRHAELEVRRRSGKSGGTEMRTPAAWKSETTAIGSPDADQVAGTRRLAGPVVSLTPERIIAFDELLGADVPNPSFDGLANKVFVQGEAISAPPGRADDFAWRHPDIDSARSDPELAKAEFPRRPIVSEGGMN
jgi:hypothetical protein